jgi:hypothetical protein
MIILVIDDMKLYGTHYCDSILQYAHSSKTAIDILQTDFSLMNEIWMNYNLKNNDTVQPVIDFLLDMAYNKKVNHITAIRILTNDPLNYSKIAAALNPYFYITNLPKHLSI